MLCSVFSMLFNFQLICFCLWWLDMDGFTAGFHVFLVFGILCKVRTSTKNLRRTDDSLSPATCKKQLEVKTALNTKQLHDCLTALTGLTCLTLWTIWDTYSPPIPQPATQSSLPVSESASQSYCVAGWVAGGEAGWEGLSQIVGEAKS